MRNKPKQPLRWLGLVMAAMLGVACTDTEGDAALAGDTIEAPVERPDFLGDQAFEHVVRQVEFGPRIPGTDGHERQLEWMRKFLRERADTVVEQRFTHVTQGGDTLRLTNLFARFSPQLRQRILLVAHWDTRPQADQDPEPANRSRPVPGANDGGSGVAVLLELADMFARQPPPVGVDILLTDGEDYGQSSSDMYLGARYFAANLPPGYDPLYGVLLDMVGDHSPRFPIEGNSWRAAPEIASRVWDLAARLGYGDLFPTTVVAGVSDDHVPLNRAGIPTIDIIDFEYGAGNRFWHTVEDVPENVSAETLEIVGGLVAELVYRGG